MLTPPGIQGGTEPLSAMRLYHDVFAYNDTRLDSTVQIACVWVKPSARHTILEIFRHAEVKVIHRYIELDILIRALAMSRLAREIPHYVRSWLYPKWKVAYWHRPTLQQNLYFDQRAVLLLR